MCGIAGLWLSGQSDASGLGDAVSRMNTALHHRGPDGGDVWVDQENGLALGQRRLAIIDLSDAGKQPMHSANGRYVMVYNGEIYNAPELREKLAAANIQVAWRGHSDTEVILECIAHWGVRDTVKRLIGMFAIALWDKQTKKLTLVRDRLGIKPLYWSRYEGNIGFASEVKALLAGNAISREVNRSGLEAYLRFGYVPSGLSIYSHAKMLKPGHILEVSSHDQATEFAYWSVEDAVLNGQKHAWSGDDQSAIDALEDLLRDAVQRRMVADVPLGAFLSGGIDSSTIVALMQSVSDRPVKTFSVGFEDEAFNEAAFAGEVARHLKTDHTELYVTPKDALDLVPKLSETYDEPFFDSSAIPTYLISALTRKEVTVALSGDGGDETFGGYTRYLWAKQLSAAAGSIPFGASLVSRGLTMLSPEQWDNLVGLVPGKLSTSAIGDKIHKAAPLLAIRDDIDRYHALLSLFDTDKLLGSRSTRKKFRVPGEKFCRNRNLDYVSSMQVMDTMMYMVDDVLTKVDRASMANSLEVRVPFIDHRVIEFGWRLPARLKMNGSVGKHALRQILYKYVPREMIDRPKTGFGVPLAQWLRGPLREWMGDLLANDALYNDFGLDRRQIEKLQQEHMSGKRNWGHQLWTISMLSDWQKRWLA
ncbi:asparagine synthase (glutamine-hydrolyzing) [Thalassospira sp. MCCC 1A02491]|uniref:asparagine synthase (glutamine-hydrolyzing) n=1 Tax=Thalassospira sp. MCCC 1A02491 TaxID=1769751 RepID=UPI0007AD6CDE|nr:asparagine synthase (glutamine-hydrolyzing) [Thalassospira sp. MCCC 1A02491]KZB62763.1 asparagine synthetase B [Thalassospira sp. MCCC 1A02491]